MGNRRSISVVVTGTAAVLGVAVTFPAHVQAEDPPSTIQITGVIRDFREWGVEGGHPDFEQMPETGFGRYAGNIGVELSEESEPVYTGEGGKIAQQWRDSESRAICPCIYDPELGDSEGHYSQPGSGGITSTETFAQWFKDTPTVNLSKTLTLQLTLQPDGTYLFDSDTDAPYAELGGFFPIDDQLYGNSEGSDHNYHFTFELHTQFEYHAGEAPYFKYEGDDTILVFINNQLVIELGAVHASHDQYLDATRLGLTEGETYPLDFYFAQRHRPQSNFSVSTNMLLETTEVPTISASYD